jgi:hypothetical protein
MAAPKRPVLDIEEFSKRAAPPAAPTTPDPLSGDDEPQGTLYCRAPLSVVTRVKDLVHARNRGKRKKVSQNDVILQAVLQYLDREGA